MKKRVTNPHHEAYDRYAGRGINICERWNHFENFLADMGPRPKGTTLERVNNDGNYEPGNCVWATYKQQAANTRANIVLTVEGVSDTLPNWAEKSGQSQNLIKLRVYAGWDHKEAIFTPSRGKLASRAGLRRKGIDAVRRLMESRKAAASAVQY